MKLLPVLIIAIIAFSLRVKAQLTKDVLINVSASAAINGTRFNIDIDRHNEDIKIVYSIFDSLRRSEMLKNDFFRIAMKGNGLRDSITVKKFLTEIKKYEVFTRDSIHFRFDSDTIYANLLKKIATSTGQQLSKGNRFGLDGINISVAILTKNSKVTVSAWTPNKDSNPEIYHLITESLNIYRQEHNNGFLDKKRTFNY